jgi:hypothetical protein
MDQAYTALYNLLKLFLAGRGFPIHGNLTAEATRWSKQEWTWEQYIEELRMSLAAWDRLETWVQDEAGYTLMLVGKTFAGKQHTRLIKLDRSLPRGLLLLPFDNCVDQPNFPLYKRGGDGLVIEYAITTLHMEVNGTNPTTKLRLREPRFVGRSIGDILPM